MSGRSPSNKITPLGIRIRDFINANPERYTARQVGEKLDCQSYTVLNVAEAHCAEGDLLSGRVIENRAIDVTLPVAPWEAAQ